MTIMQTKLPETTVAVGPGSVWGGTPVTPPAASYPLLFAKIAKARDFIAGEGLAKSGKNAAQGFAYRTIDDVWPLFQKALAATGLIHSFSIVDQKIEYHPSGKQGRPIQTAEVRVEYRLIDVDTGCCLATHSGGSAVDNSDKALFKALSMCHKYWFIGQFSVPLEGQVDGDADSPEIPNDSNFNEEQVLASLRASYLQAMHAINNAQSAAEVDRAFRNYQTDAHALADRVKAPRVVEAVQKSCTAVADAGTKAMEKFEGVDS